METQQIKFLQKSQFKNLKRDAETAACCGGAALSNEDACCKLDEDKKAKGESGCGCNTSTTKSGCC